MQFIEIEKENKYRTNVAGINTWKHVKRGTEENLKNFKEAIITVSIERSIFVKNICSFGTISQENTNALVKKKCITVQFFFFVLFHAQNHLCVVLHIKSCKKVTKIETNIETDLMSIEN